MLLISRAKEIAAGVKSAFPRILRAVLSFLKATRLVEGIAYVLAMIFALVPLGFIGQFLNWALARESIWIGLTVVAVLAVFLVLFASLMTNEQFLRDVRLQGVEWPSLLSVVLAWFAVLVFGGLSGGFERLGIVKIEPSVPCTEGCATRYADLYLWHLFDSIPGIKFNETIGWTQRYTYTDKLSGWLVLLFKVLVIVSVINSFVVSGRIRREAKAVDPRVP